MISDKGQSPGSRTYLSPGLQDSCRGVCWDAAPLLVQPGECLGVSTSVENLMSLYVNFWQGINAHNKCTKV